MNAFWTDFFSDLDNGAVSRELLTEWSNNYIANNIENILDLLESHDTKKAIDELREFQDEFKD
jgi:hypothetical protein